MSVKSSFLILTMLTFLVAIAVEFFIWMDERKNVNVMAEQHAHEMVEGFKQLLILRSDPYKKQALDYAAWNDLANFTEHPEPSWAKDNLEASIIQFGINGFYILNQDKKVIFNEVDKPFLADLSSILNPKLLDPSSAEMLHFFVSLGRHVVEFYVAPIHRIDEKVTASSRAKGFVVIAKHWDEAFLDELSRYAIAKARFTKMENSEENYVMAHEVPLKGLRGEKVATLYLHMYNRMSEVLDHYGSKDLKLTIAHTVILMILFALLIAKYITFPLRDISLALKLKEKKPLQKYLHSSNEYGAIARELSDAFETKEALEYLNRNLERKVSEEVEKSRLKDKMLFQQAKLAALGDMLNAIAHQWRQPLNTISVVMNKIYLESQMKKLTPETLESEIVNLRGLIQNMSTTIDDFKDFFKQDAEKVLFALHKAIEESIKISDNGFALGDIAIDVECAPDIRVYGFQKELSQVLLVLINNAKDAIVKKQIRPGVITIKANAQDHYIILEVSDNGGGVNEAYLGHIFDPFFTTKEPTGSNGTGLYISKQIIEQSMQGSITAFNERGGLVVTIVLPKEKV